MRAHVHPIADEGLGNTSYIVEVARGLAVSIDPPRDTTAHTAIAERLGASIIAVLETHLHADFVSGSRELSATTGAALYAPRGADLSYAHSPVGPGEDIAVGDVVLRAIATPGHTPEHLAYVLVEEGRRSAVFSGGSLIAGGAARTDLIHEAMTEQLTRAQFDSLRTVVALGDDLALHPTHGGGSFCSAGGGGAGATTIGAERRSNPLLLFETADAFAEHVLAGYGSFPRYFLHLRAVNRAGPPLLRDLAEPRPLSTAEVTELMAEGAWLIDGRPIAEWARVHPRGAVSIAIRPQFAPWLGWVVPFGAPIVLVAEEPARSEAIVQARRIGYDRVLGWLEGGMDAWEAAGLETASVSLVPVETAFAMARNGAMLLDVRQRNEWERGHIAGATHLELGDVIAGKQPDGKSFVTYCNHGERSATAASLLERRGAHVANFPGGFPEWKDAGLPVDR